MFPKHVDAASLIACHHDSLHFRWYTLRQPEMSSRNQAVHVLIPMRFSIDGV